MEENQKKVQTGTNKGKKMSVNFLRYVYDFFYINEKKDECIKGQRSRRKKMRIPGQEERIDV